jgi:hypothetical protein
MELIKPPDFSEIPQDPVRPFANDFRWVTGNDSAIVHVRFIDAGAFGEVHEVSAGDTKLTI